MQTANNQIFSSQNAANGAWRNVNDWTALSIHFEGLEGNVWVEVSNDPNCDPNLNANSSTVSGVPITGNLGAKAVNPADTTDQADTAYTTDGSQAMWSPSCLVWNYVRVCKDTTAQTKVTKAFLFGQIG